MGRKRKLTLEETNLISSKLSDEQLIEKFIRNCLLRNLRLATIECCRRTKSCCLVFIFHESSLVFGGYINNPSFLIVVFPASKLLGISTTKLDNF